MNEKTSVQPPQALRPVGEVKFCGLHQFADGHESCPDCTALNAATPLEPQGAPFWMCEWCTWRGRELKSNRCPKCGSNRVGHADDQSRDLKVCPFKLPVRYDRMSFAVFDANGKKLFGLLGWSNKRVAMDTAGHFIADRINARTPDGDTERDPRLGLALQRIKSLESENAELTRKGVDLCYQNGALLMERHEIAKFIDHLKPEDGYEQGWIQLSESLVKRRYKS